MKIIKTIIAPFLALSLALFASVVPCTASGLNNTGYHDDGVGGDGNHYFEIYYDSTDSLVDCSPYAGTDGHIAVGVAESLKVSGGQWVESDDVSTSYDGVSGFSHHECQINVYLTNGAGQREIKVQWWLNDALQSTQYGIFLTF